MPNSADALRRWFGLLFLALAFGMLIWGQTVLREKLEKTHTLFLAYWAMCFVFTFAAILVALIDMRITRKRARQEHNELVQRTLEKIEHEDGDDPK
jgi:TRAP-type C4-dicarboxylate transport system permease small subunit